MSDHPGKGVWSRLSARHLEGLLGAAMAAGEAAGSPRKRAALLVLASIVIGGVGLSRVYLGVHYPSDVLSGILLGSAWALFLETARRYFFPKTR